MNTEHRWWGAPLGVGNDLAWWFDEKICKSVLPQAVTNATDFLIPAKSTQLATIEHFVHLGIKGECQHTKIGPAEYIAFESKL